MLMASLKPNVAALASFLWDVLNLGVAREN